ncbi:hypothetical protein L873DRAFT_434739 [Choiromyces venosus 120613-1]|uniref:Uncharacterized protein n=1 Tax=Choiromyces venosus 120613-1 TaxID=1336337 RepID=A0A3N4J1P0_9PEZI|nr:hypothetical protein L873DRAFT_434739 [Choiromyces venosus 120613-1]
MLSIAVTYVQGRNFLPHMWVVHFLCVQPCQFRLICRSPTVRLCTSLGIQGRQPYD